MFFFPWDDNLRIYHLLSSIVQYRYNWFVISFLNWAQYMASMFVHYKNKSYWGKIILINFWNSNNTFMTWYGYLTKGTSIRCVKIILFIWILSFVSITFPTQRIILITLDVHMGTCLSQTFFSCDNDIDIVALLGDYIEGDDNEVQQTEPKMTTFRCPVCSRVLKIIAGFRGHVTKQHE